MTTRHASCSCGQLTATCTGEPTRISVCHCLNCQRRSGSTFAVQARFPVANVAITGTSNEWSLAGDEGGVATFHSCPTCSATVYYRIRDIPDQIAIPVGTFADPSFPAPRVSVYEKRRHRWVAVNVEGIVHEE